MLYTAANDNAQFLTFIMPAQQYELRVWKMRQIKTHREGFSGRDGMLSKTIKYYKFTWQIKK